MPEQKNHPRGWNADISHQRKLKSYQVEIAWYFKFPKKEKGGGSIWDFAATSCIFNEAGIPVTDIFGNPLELNNSELTFMNRLGVFYSSNSIVVNKVMELYKTINYKNN